MARNYQNLSCAAAEDDYVNNKSRTSFKLFGAVINVSNNPEKKEEEEQQQVVIENNCSSSSSEITTLESYPSSDSVKSDVVILSDDEELEQSGARNAIWKRKRGESWSEEEHRLFLAGLEKLGSGRWKRIAEEFVPTRTPTQVASHAQKYFMRKASTSNGCSIRRRGSIFDNTPTSSLSTGALGESSARAANRVSLSPEVGPIVHVPCRVVRWEGGKVRLVPLFKRRPNFATVNNQGNR